MLHLSVIRCTILCLLVGLTMGTSDQAINIHQLQFVADHLTECECVKLKTALHQTGFAVNATMMAELENAKANRPCIYYLLVWDRISKTEKALNDLTVRLKQIGRQDLADKLATSVFGEELEVLEKNFLDDPFKKNIPEHSVLLAIDDEEDSPEEAPDEEDERLTGWQIFSIVITSLVVVTAGIMLVYKLFGDVTQRMCLRYAPKFLVTWATMVRGECRWFCKKTKRSIQHHVIGMERKKPDRRELMEMNRNLNNYLNGHLKDAFYYFRDIDRDIDRH